MRSVITPLVYIWVNIDTRGCIKSPEKPKDSCGHLVPPFGLLPGFRSPGLIGLKKSKLKQSGGELETKNKIKQTNEDLVIVVIGVKNSISTPTPKRLESYFTC